MSSRPARSCTSGCLVALTRDVEYDVVTVGGVKSMIFGGEGCVLRAAVWARDVWLQRLPFSRLAGRIAANMLPLGRGAGEGSVLGPLGNLLRGN